MFDPVNMALIHEMIYRKAGQDLLTQHIFPMGLFTDGLTPEVKEEILPGLQITETWL